ncbi:glycoside hydrolase family 13 protein [Streptomyces sp. NPDC101132]|uniref:glycoside hydrolase family 13 protein n=1 Tax=Streptomyces sp. NPDC101132 TaxID=3366110 RepID=UPI0038013ADE
MAASALPENDPDWWRTAVIYQVYVRSFADGDGDGTGDLAGVRARLPYLAALGVDALWFTPWYLSPLADGGYDVADYRTIDPAFGTLAEAEKLIAEARALGIRTIVDIVPNHVSDRHPWFRAALAAGPGSPERELFHFRPGRGPDGGLPPGDWPSQFAGAGTWTRVPDGEWYLHLFTPQQPDLNWAHPAVRREHEDVLRFWFERGVAGVRIDSAALLAKDPALPDLAGRPAGPWSGPEQHPYIDRDELHEVYRSWRAVADEYGGVFVGEVWLPDTERFTRYLRPDELHTAFNFAFLACPWDAGRLRAAVDDTLAEHAPVGAPATWVLCNHDVTRTVTRYGRADTGFDFAAKAFGTPTDPVLGTRRARAAALLTLALPGSVYVYQGEELGLPEADVPLDRIQDPMHFRSGGRDPGRDGCRVPLPWTAEPWRTPWLPQPADWGAYAADRQEADPGSMLSLYRAALALRRGAGAFGAGELRWLPSPAGVLVFARPDGLVCAVNLSPEPYALPAHAELLLSSDPLDGRSRLPQDTAAWLRP